MTQYIRAAQAYGVVSATVSQAASIPSTDLQKLQARIFARLGVTPGTSQLGTEKSITVGSVTKALQIPDSVYAAAVAAGVDFSDCLYNSSTSEGTYSSTSETPTMSQPGLHRQICLAIGDSLTEGTTGAGSYPDLTVQANQLWSFGADSAGLPLTYSLTTATPQSVKTNRWAHEKSRIIYDFGHGGWRCANQSGYTYTQGSPWDVNVGQMSYIAVASSQQICAYIFLGTNDINYADLNGNAGLASDPTAGSPDYFTNALTPLITALKAQYPTIKIIWQSPVARGASATPLNNKFITIASYAIANKSALGIDIIVDSRQIPQFDPTTPTVTNNTAYYQNDNTHLTTDGYALMKPYRRAAYDLALGFAVPSGIASAFA